MSFPLFLFHLADFMTMHYSFNQGLIPLPTSPVGFTHCLCFDSKTLLNVKLDNRSQISVLTSVFKISLHLYNPHSKYDLLEKYHRVHLVEITLWSVSCSGHICVVLNPSIPHQLCSFKLLFYTVVGF